MWNWKPEDSDVWFILKTTCGGPIRTGLVVEIIRRQYQGRNQQKLFPYTQHAQLMSMDVLKYGYPFRFRFEIGKFRSRIIERVPNGELSAKLVEIDKKNNLALYKIT